MDFLQDLLKSDFEAGLSVLPDESGEAIVVSGQSFLAVDVLKAFPEAYETSLRSWIWDDWLPPRIERLEKIKAFRSNESRFEELSEAASLNYVFPFVGSGMSVPSGFPSWSGFLRKVCEDSRLSPEALEAYIEAGDFEEAASELRNGIDVLPKALSS